MPSNEHKTAKSSINQKIEQLDRIVEWFYSDEFNLDEALEHYQKARDLSVEINRNLAELKNQVQVLADFTKD